MKGIKKILVSLVTVAMLLCVGTVNVFAEDKTITIKLVTYGTDGRPTEVGVINNVVVDAVNDFEFNTSSIENLFPYTASGNKKYVIKSPQPKTGYYDNGGTFEATIEVKEYVPTMVDTTLFVNMKCDGLNVGQVILHKESEEGKPVLFSYAEFRDKITVTANGVKYYVPEGISGDFFALERAGDSHDVDVEVVADVVTTRFKVNLLENGVLVGQKYINVVKPRGTVEMLKIKDYVEELALTIDDIPYVVTSTGDLGWTQKNGGEVEVNLNVQKDVVDTHFIVNLIDKEDGQVGTVHIHVDSIRGTVEQVKIADYLDELNITVNDVPYVVTSSGDLGWTKENGGDVEVDVNVKKDLVDTRFTVNLVDKDGVLVAQKYIHVLTPRGTVEQVKIADYLDELKTKVNGVPYVVTSTGDLGWTLAEGGEAEATVNVADNSVDTTLFVNLKYGDQYVGQVILHKTSEKNDPVTFKYEDYRDQLTVVANNVKYYVPEEVVGDFAWTLAEGGEAEANVDVIADEKELTLQVDFIYNGSNPIATVYLHKTVLLGESYKFTMEDLEKEVPGLVFESNNLECLNGAIEFTIPEDFLSGDWAEVSSLETEPHVYASDVVPATEAETKLVVEFKCNGVTVGDTVELVKENLIKTTTYTFTTEDLAGELPGLTFKVGDDVYEVIDADPLSGEWATVTAGDSHTYSVDVLKLAKPAKPSTGGSSSSTTNTTTKPVVNTSAK